MKQSKKRWNWTEKQIRNTFPGRYWGDSTAPKWYCRGIQKGYKTKTKNSLHKVKRGFDTDYLEFGRTNHRHSASWLWW